jgi:translocation and assembly module TamA
LARARPGADRADRRQHDRPRAYDAKSFFVAAALERQTNLIWQKKWTWSVGGELIATDERDVNIATGTTRSRTFFIGALPGTLAYDGSNDLLDPTEGFRLAGPPVSGGLVPEQSVRLYARADRWDLLPARDGQCRDRRPGAARHDLRRQARPDRAFEALLCWRRRIGARLRFQRLGPRDPVFNDPIGGRSLAEFALEARVRIGNFGIVPFIDAGNIYTSPLPELDDLRFGAGVGIRYHTRFGPIRVDVGTPLSRQAGDPRVAVTSRSAKRFDGGGSARTRRASKAAASAGPSRIAKTIVALLLALASPGRLCSSFLDTDAGHRFLADR